MSAYARFKTAQKPYEKYPGKTPKRSRCQMSVKWSVHLSADKN